MREFGYEMDMLSVGNKSKSGDAILLRYGDLYTGGNQQAVILIDGGYCETANTIKETLKAYYNCQNDKGNYVIDLLILSHPDQDHVNGLVELTKDPQIEIKHILMHHPWYELKSSHFADGRITDASIERKLRDIFPKANELEQNTQSAEHLSCEPQTYECLGAKIHILGPSLSLYKQLIAECSKTPNAADFVNEQKSFSNDDLLEEVFVEGQSIDWNNEETTSVINETSLIILFEYAEHRILFTGDAGKRGLTEAISFANANNINITDLTLIKMPHHGSRKNVNPEIMDNLGKIGTSCYISCVKGDEGHHPSKRLVNLLNQKGFRVVTSSGKTIWRHHNAPAREGYTKVIPLPYYRKMEKL